MQQNESQPKERFQQENIVTPRSTQFTPVEALEGFEGYVSQPRQKQHPCHGVARESWGGLPWRITANLDRSDHPGSLTRLDSGVSCEMKPFIFQMLGSFQVIRF